MKIGTRLIVGFLAITALIWVTFFFAVNTHTKVGQKFEVLKEDVLPTLITLSDIGLGVSEVSHESREYIYSGEEETKQSILSTIKQLKNDGLMHLEQHIPLGDEEKRTSEELVVKIDTFSLAVVELIDLKEQGVSFEQLLEEDNRKTDLLARVLIEQLRERKAFDEEKLAEAEEAVTEAHTSGMKILLLTAGIVTILATGIALLITRSIANPLRALHIGTEQIGQGNLDYKVGTGAKDEIGQLSRAFDRMTEDLKKTTTSIDNLNKEIIKRKQTEEALHESEERYRALMNLGAEVGEAIVMLQDTEQGEGMHTFVSNQWSRITGYSEKELLDMSFFNLVHPKERDASIERHRRKMAGEEMPGLFEMSIARKDGVEVVIEITSAFTTYKGERVNVVYVRDITERKKMGK